MAKRELLAEVDFGSQLDGQVLKGLQTLVNTLKGTVELLYEGERWLLRVYRETKPPRVKPRPRRGKPKAPRGFIQETVRLLLRKEPGLAGKPAEVVEAVMKAAGEKGYSRRGIPMLVKGHLKRLQQGGEKQ